MDGSGGWSRPTRRRIWAVQWGQVVVDAVGMYATGRDVRVVMMPTDASPSSLEPGGRLRAEVHVYRRGWREYDREQSPWSVPGSVVLRRDCTSGDGGVVSC
jgi:hypothetical protein